jgi:hypothetical protein
MRNRLPISGRVRAPRPDGVASPIHVGTALVERRAVARGMYDVARLIGRPGGGCSNMDVEIGGATPFGATLSVRAPEALEVVASTDDGAYLIFRDETDLRAFAALLVTAMTEAQRMGLIGADARVTP